MKRKAFTLVELLLAVSIVLILTGLSIAIFGAVNKTIQTTKTKSQIDKIKLALVDYKNVYGEYPMATTRGNDTVWQKVLIEALRGDTIIARKNKQIQILPYTEAGLKQRREFINLLEFNLDKEKPVEATKILDVWDNPIWYRYNYITSGKIAKEWVNPDCLLISAGPDFNTPITAEDYFNSEELQLKGLPNLNPDDAEYYYADKRSDNITNF